MKDNNKNDDIIYMDEDSYKRWLIEIENLKWEKSVANLERSKVCKRGTDIAWDNAEFNELERYISVLDDSIKSRELFLDKVIIVKRKNIDGVVDFGDVLRLNISDEFGDEEIIVKLVGDTHYKDVYTEISCNSLIGALIYGKKIGTKVSYKINGMDCFIEILEKIDLDEEKKKGITKKLIKDNNL